MRTPVVLIIFNRPDYTRRVFESIRQIQPAKLLVIADGPRPDHPDDVEKCAASRAIIDQVDWGCEVLKNFSDENLGCGLRPATGISWVFENVEEAIILEDDCIPHPTFFQFCDELLERYRNDERVMLISGNNFWANKHQRQESYVFSRYTLSWGWATWKRSWQHYDFDMKLWAQLEQQAQVALLTDILGDRHAANSWTKVFRHVQKENLDCWDYQWTLTCWLQGGLSIHPYVNLVSNIGFGLDATHTFSAENSSIDCPQLSLPSEAMSFPLKHPKFILRDPQIDQFIQSNLLDYHPKLTKRIQLKLKKILKR